jgi:hypothetical protein
VVIASAIIPTVIAQMFFEPRVRPSAGGLVVRPANFDENLGLDELPVMEFGLNDQSTQENPNRERKGGP